MRGVNRVIVAGNLGADPETRYTGNGTAITSIRIATSESWTDKQSGEKQERTEWHRVKLFGRLAEIAGEYLKKGRQVYIEGSLRTDKYTDKDGVERFSTDIIASEMQMLGGGQGEGDGQRGNGGGGNRQQGNNGGGNRQGNGDGNGYGQRQGGNGGGHSRGGDNYGGGGQERRGGYNSGNGGGQQRGANGNGGGTTGNYGANNGNNGGGGGGADFDDIPFLQHSYRSLVL